LRLACRNFRHAKRKGKARRALSRLRTIAGVLLRELQRKLPARILERENQRFSQYEQVLSQKINDKNKIYSLHEPDIYCVGKGKDHKPYEYGRKASVVSTLNSKIIVGVVSHDEHTHDSKTLTSALAIANRMRVEPIQTAVVDRGYRGAKKQNTLEIILPSPPLKRDTEIEKNRKRALCRRRSGIEPIIGHLKQDYRLTRNWLKGSVGDSINLLMAACAWNLRKWMAIFFVFDANGHRVVLAVVVLYQHPGAILCLRMDSL
jgi:IS5 family transposase